MWKRSWVLVAILGLTTSALGQSAGGEKKDYSQSPVFVKMMAMDKNKDGKLTKDEITDQRGTKWWRAASGAGWSWG